MAYLQVWYNPDEASLAPLLLRSFSEDTSIAGSVGEILASVKAGGDATLFELERRFDKAELTNLKVTEAEIREAQELVSAELKAALHQAYENLLAFHSAQKSKGEQLEVSEGVELSRMVVPIQKVGLYVPGGTAPLFSTVLMLSVPALVAGCPKVVLCTPPNKEGNVHPAILYAASLCKVSEIYKVGGAQAIAAMAYGTQTIPKVDKVFGPGNRYVTAAKVQVSSSCCAIDMPAGPSEVMVVASVDADPAFVASDLLSQAEHGADSQAMLVIQAEKEEGFAYLERVEQALSAQMETLGRQDYLLSSLGHSRAFIIPSLIGCAELVNRYAPEHLIINTREPEALQEMVVNAGSIFLGPYSCETAGDYASGTNHTLPTNGWATSYSGVSTDSYIKKITVQKLSKRGLQNLGPTLLRMAEAENLGAHRNAVAIRLGDEK